MRALLRKDLLILGRSRLLCALLVLYPIAIALLLGLAISRSPARARVAIVNETPPGQTLRVAGQQIPLAQYLTELFDQVQAVPEPTRARAAQAVEGGSAVAAVVIPADLAVKLASDLAQAQVEILYNGNALEQSLARSTLESALAQANLAFSAQVQQSARSVIKTLLDGGSLGVIGAPEALIGLQRIPSLIAAVAARQPHGRDRRELERIDAFAGFAAQNLLAASRVLATIGQPIRVHEVLLRGRRTPLSSFAVVVAVSLSLMFISILLAAGALALEREEHALSRLLRGPISRTALLAEKILLAAGCSLPIAFAMLAGIGAFVTLSWSRVGSWLLALAFAAIALAALGLAIGALAREVRAASLLAFALSLPLAFLALVPAASVSGGLHDVIATISFVFPYKAALQALDSAVNGSSPALWLTLVHLAVLAAAFAALARFGLRELE